MKRANLWNPRLNRRHFLTITAGATATWLLSACTSTAARPPQPTLATDSGQPQRGGILRLAFSDTPTGIFDPGMVFSWADYAAASVVFERLVWVDPADPTFTIQPGLAESWAVSEDGMTWTFSLRQGVIFHHGTPFASKDVAHTFERVLNPAFGSPARLLIKAVQQVEAVDEYTVRFQLNSPDFSLLYKLRWENLSIVPHDRTEQELTTHPMGTGPFKFAGYVPGNSLTFTRHETYWDQGLPYLDEVQHLYLSDAATAVAALTSGTLDVITQLAVENIAMLEANSDITVIEAMAYMLLIFHMRVDQEPFTDVRVRQALKLVVDRQGIMTAVLQGRGQVGNDQIIPPTNPYWANIPAPAHDIERAKQLLAEAGYADGLDLTLFVTDFGAKAVDVAVALQEMAKPAGINIQIERVPVENYWTEIYKQKAFFVDLWPYSIDPDEYMAFGFEADSIYNGSGWHTPELDALIQAGRSEQEEEQRRVIYTQIQQLISEQGGMIVPYFLPVYSAMRNVVYDVSPDLVPLVRSAWITQ